MEFKILNSLDFDVTFPTTFRFLERYNSLSDGSQQVLLLACYLSELCLVEANMNKWLPSRMASAALFLARNMLKTPKAWSKDLASAA